MLDNKIASLKRECSGVSRYLLRYLIFGCIFLFLSVIFLYAASAPMWTGHLRIFPGGTFAVFTCYFFSVIFCFLYGAILSALLMMRRSYKNYCSRAILDLTLAYVFRIVWLMLLFCGFAPVFSLVCIIASLVFLIFTIFNTYHFTSLFTVLVFISVISSSFFAFFTLRFMLYC